MQDARYVRLYADEEGESHFGEVEVTLALVDFAPPYVPNHKNIVLYATGWAGKFVPLLGKILSDLALDGRTPFDISHFALGHIYFKALAKAS